MLDGQAVRVPAEAALDVEAAHGPVARHDVLDGRCQQVPVVRQPRCEGRAIVEGEGRPLGGELELPLEGGDAGPVLEHGLFLLWKIH